MDRCWNKNIVSLVLFCDDSNEPAKLLYQHNGQSMPCRHISCLYDIDKVIEDIRYKSAGQYYYYYYYL